MQNPNGIVMILPPSVGKAKSTADLFSPHVEGFQVTKPLMESISSCLRLSAELKSTNQMNAYSLLSLLECDLSEILGIMREKCGECNAFACLKDGTIFYRNGKGLMGVTKDGRAMKIRPFALIESERIMNSLNPIKSFQIETRQARMFLDGLRAS